MSYDMHFSANQLGGLKKVCVTREYALSGLWVKRESTVHIMHFWCSFWLTSWLVRCSYVYIESIWQSDQSIKPDMSELTLGCVLSGPFPLFALFPSHCLVFFQHNQCWHPGCLVSLHSFRSFIRVFIFWAIVTIVVEDLDVSLTQGSFVTRDYQGLGVRVSEGRVRVGICVPLKTPILFKGRGFFQGSAKGLHIRIFLLKTSITKPYAFVQVFYHY